MIKILISNNGSSLEEELKKFSCFATVEAEYGDICIEGSLPELTLAHHGARSKNPPPCIGGVLGDIADIEAIGISHVDLDTLGGIMRLLAHGSNGWSQVLVKAQRRGFFKVAGSVDVRGPHYLDKILLEEFRDDEEHASWIRAEMYAFWAYSEQNRITAPRDGSVADVTSDVRSALDILARIISNDIDLLAEGQEWFSKQQDLENESFRFIVGSVIVREADKFVNHLYVHEGEIYPAVVAFNSDRKTITVSLAETHDKINCSKVVQELWGLEAGGHECIAGSPRGREMTFGDASALAILLNSYFDK